MNIGEVLTPFEHKFISLLKGIMVFFALSLAILMVTTVILRYGVEKPFLAIEEAAVLLGLWFYFIGGAYVTTTRTHICGGALHLIVKTESAHRRVKFFTSLLCLLVATVTTYYAIQYGWFTFEKGRKSTYLQWPKTLWVASMVFGFMTITLFLIVQSFRDFRLLKNTVKKRQ